MEEDKSLIPTVETTIFAGEYGADDITFLIEKKYNGVQLDTATVSCKYILPNGYGGSEELTKDSLPYNDDLYQYKFPIGKNISSEPGKVEIWLSIMSGGQSIIRSGSVFITISPTKDITEYLPPDDKTQLDVIAAKVAELEMSKADSISYDPYEKTLQLTASGHSIGSPVSTADIADDDDIIVFGLNDRGDPNGD